MFNIRKNVIILLRFKDARKYIQLVYNSCVLLLRPFAHYCFLNATISFNIDVYTNNMRSDSYNRSSVSVYCRKNWTVKVATKYYLDFSFFS